MFKENLFSIGITKCHINGLDNGVLSEVVYQNCKEDYIPTTNTIKDVITHAKNSARGILPDCHPELKKLNDIVLKETQCILDGIINNSEVNDIKTYIKRVWGNKNVNNDIAIPHAHRDSFLSVVYYPKVEEGVIHFYSPFTDAFLAHVPIGRTKEFHEYNSTYYEFEVQTGWLMIFPSMLTHYVPPTTKERLSIVYDIGVRDESI